MNRSFQIACCKLVQKRITFKVFLSVTGPVWVQYAKMLKRRWDAPSVDLADILQDLHLAAFMFASSYDPNRGVEPWRYLTYNAADKAKKRLHQMRGAYRGINGNRDGSKARAPVTESSFVDSANKKENKKASGLVGDFGVVWARDTEDHATQVEKKIFVERAIAACSRFADRVTLQTFMETGDAGETAIKLYANPETRFACRFMSDEDAEKKVKATLKNLVENLDRVA